MKKQTGHAPSVVKAVGFGTALGAMWTLVCAMILAKLVDGEVLSMEKIGYGSMVTQLSAVFLGATAAFRRGGHMGMACALAMGLSYYLLLLLVNALFFGGHFTGMGITLMLVVLASGGAVLAAGKGSGRKPRRHYKIPK